MRCAPTGSRWCPHRGRLTDTSSTECTRAPAPGYPMIALRRPLPAGCMRDESAPRYAVATSPCWRSGYAAPDDGTVSPAEVPGPAVHNSREASASRGCCTVGRLNDNGPGSRESGAGVGALPPVMSYGRAARSWRVSGGGVEARPAPPAAGPCRRHMARAGCRARREPSLEPTGGPSPRSRRRRRRCRSQGDPSRSRRDPGVSRAAALDRRDAAARPSPQFR